MTLSNRSAATKGPYRKHDFPEQIAEEDLPEVLEKVKGGDKKAIEVMILGHGRLAVSIVNRYVNRFNLSRFIDDLDSSAIEGVVVAVNRIAEGRLSHDNPTGYIVAYIHQYVSKCVRTNAVVYIPKWKKEVHYPGPLSSDLTTKGGEDEVDFDDLVASIAKTDAEKQILELRRQGHNDTEIADLLDLSRSKVSRTRHNLFHRFLKKEGRHVAAN